MIVITGTVTTTPETRAQIEALCIEHSRRSRAEPGCIAHNIHTDCEDANRLVFVELWADDAAVKAHFALPASGETVRAMAALSPAPPEMTIYRSQVAPFSDFR